ncbi:CmpA/NrtA family ABC transporter substrate-binding protein [Oscillatoria sp. FACHB-1406]|uniref:CmpA/NrtA family ABC transporter substrate-binding protein n=1 Tax=Oscillatoria sp. FACHB-1406 TaxID=2692846 RepID=UPI0016829488|nr:CmpA/NrtA family ABC transporter substrate-binding protein [Oscillatoria sp. FACHB-1406]MBD2577705.1 ABC transporter substrate-binding protein [Oscillatoria sp. FACHB-1406]
MTQFSRLSRRKFLYTAGASTGAILLKGCLGNPPDRSGGGTTASSPASSPAATPVELSPEQKPEVTKVKLGFIPIFESAPLIIAKEKGFFAKYGMPDIEVAKQSNWASARDNVVIGSEKGGIDGGQWQMPMPHLITEGIITNGQKVPMYVLAQLVTQANGIAISGKNQGQGVNLKLDSKAVDYIKGFASANGRKFKAAHTFPNVNQDFWIRYWFGAGGIDPDTDIDLLAVPPPETVQGMRTGTIDAFSTGDPWPYRIVSDKIGYMAALTAQIWKCHPEEYLAIRADWVDKNPKATKAILKGLMEAQQWCDKPENRPELIQIVSGRNYFNINPTILTPPYEGKYEMGDGQPAVDDFKMGPLYWKDDLGSVSYPYKSHDLWFLTETMRWNFHNGYFKDFDTAKKLIDKVNRGDLWVEAAKEAGIAAADIPTSDSRGVEKFFDGVEFDPEKPQAYLDSLKIKKA